jgi:2-polyprenyl-6-methoxyphenol hydroxylase-like FAD-dependent oxidoreductase
MRYTDIAIIGGGLAGSTAAAMLGRADIATLLVDPHPVYPPDFRVEKLGGDKQIERFRKTGLADAVLRQATLAEETWIARFGYLLDKAPRQQFGIMYDALVNAIRAEIASQVETIFAKAVSISTSGDRQRVALSNDVVISARLVVMANGLNVGLRQMLGIERHVVSPAHSISIGFDVAPIDRSGFDFPALTYFSERPSDRIPYLTLFPIGKRMRANLFVYREIGDPWLREMRLAPVKTLHAALPHLGQITGDFAVAGEVKIRPVDLCVNTGYRRAGLVLVGDAFETTCPVSGSGTDKVFVDVERLCNTYIPAWLATEGMDEAKIAAFYDDPVKRDCDAWSIAKACTYRAVSIERGLYWSAQRWARFVVWLSRGWLRTLLRLLRSARSPRRAAHRPELITAQAPRRRAR